MVIYTHIYTQTHTHIPTNTYIDIHYIYAYLVSVCIAYKPLLSHVRYVSHICIIFIIYLIYV